MKYWVLVVDSATEIADHGGAAYRVLKGTPVPAAAHAHQMARDYCSKASGRFAVVAAERDTFSSSVVVEHAGLASSDVGPDIPGGGAR